MKLKRLVRWTGTLFATAMLLLVVAMLMLYVPPIQDAIAQWTAKLFTQQMGTKIEVEKVRIQFPLRIKVEGLRADSLLDIESLATDIRLRPLMQGTIEASYVSARGISIHIDTPKASTQVSITAQRLSANNIAYHVHERKAYVQRLLLSDGYATLQESTIPPKEDTTTNGLPLSLNVSEIQLLRVGTDYLSSQMSLQGIAGQISLYEAAVDTTLSATLLSAEITDGAFTLKQSDMEPWEITNLSARADSLCYNPSSIAGRLTKLTFRESHGINLQEATMAFEWQDGMLNVPQLALRTDHSTLSGHLRTLGRNASNMTIDGDADIRIGYADALHWAQKADGISQEALRLYPTETLSASIALNGTLEQLQLTRCHLSLPTAFDFNLSGRAHNIASPQRRTAQCHIEATTYDLDFLGNLIGNTKERRFSIPSDITLSGDISYAPDTMHAQCAIALDEGRAILEGGYRPTSKAFALYVETDSLDIRQIAPHEGVGIASLQAHLVGSSLDYKEEGAIIRGAMQIHTLQWGEYTFSNASMQAATTDGQLLARATYGDSLMQWHLASAIKYSSDTIKARIYAQIDDLNLRALQIADTDIRPALQCRATLRIGPDSTYSLHSSLSNIALRTATQNIQPRPLDLQATLTADTALLSISSGDLALTASAHIDGLPWGRKQPDNPSGSTLPDYLTHLQAALTVGEDNPVSNYLGLMGVKFRTIHATINDQGGNAMGRLTIRGVAAKGIETDSIGLTARYTDGVLSAHLQSKPLTWQTPQMQLQGKVEGTFVWGNTFAPDKLSGQILLSDVLCSIPAYSLQLHTTETLAIPLERGRLSLNALPLYSTGKQPLLLDGSIVLFGGAPSLQLRLTARNVNLLQPLPTREAVLYGKALISGDVTLSGPLNTLSVGGNLQLRPGSSIHYIFKDAILTASNQLDNVVTFVSFDADTPPASSAKARLVTNSLSMNLNLTIAPTAQLEVSLGASKQNDVVLQGGGTLNLQYIPATGMRLSGKYTIEAGELNMNVPLLHVSHMAIRPGSAITWSGNPQNPQLNITAEDRIRASVTLDGSPQSILFVTGVSLTDTMEKLNVQFTLAAPESASMQNTLATLSPEERGKLSVALLTTGLYLGEGGTGNLMNTALMGILQAQLDNISRDAFRTVDVSVGIEPLPDGVSGVSTRTDYSFSVAKRLWNNRIRIIIGGSVTTNNERIEDDAVIDNISIEWRITPAGNQYLRFFYDKNYESILEGEIRETGVGYAYRKSF